ncbi:EamA family transporter [Alkalilimnicola ehrlichii]|uniref:EamA family transporter n=2 Tax=Alkalilimnicola ehrlichii TaxID=351052 RepID=A0A3E0WLH7_9GAMM|nr:EamA family transporter [Alkalilimnicola ehrlichii]RFA33812.1 EamA family transporter [Alkalilimnicola ehrlichii]
MWLLWLITAIWAFSFSLIDVYLARSVDSYIAVFLRMLLAASLFLPILRWKALRERTAFVLMAIGGVQIGMTYLLLYHAFAYLTVPEILLFTIFTPLYITLIDELVLNRQHVPLRWWLAAGLAVFGAAVIRYDAVSEDFIVGFLLIQAANVCFAAGQIAYKRALLGSVREQAQVFGWFFIGALIVSGIGTALFGDWSRSPQTAVQWGVLIWLGLGASGLGYLGWNMATKWVNTGQLATMNNMLIPAGILVNFLFWNRDIDWLRLLIGGTIIVASVMLCQARRDLATPLARES